MKSTDSTSYISGPGSELNVYVNIHESSFEDNSREQECVH